MLVKRKGGIRYEEKQCACVKQLIAKSREELILG